MEDSTAVDCLNLVFKIITKSFHLEDKLLLNDLCNWRNDEKQILPIQDQLNTKSIKEHFSKVSYLNKAFPYVLEPCLIETKYSAKSVSAFKIRRSKIVYSVNENNRIEIHTYQFSSLSLFLRLMIYLKESEVISKQINNIRYNSITDFLFNYIQFANLTVLPISLTQDWLIKSLGIGYSYGQLVDFIDNQYDIYKQIHLSPNLFHSLFRFFGQSIIEIADNAFDFYNTTRNARKSWISSTDNYLQNTLFLSEDLSGKIVSNIFQ